MQVIKAVSVLGCRFNWAPRTALSSSNVSDVFLAALLECFGISCRTDQERPWFYCVLLNFRLLSLIVTKLLADGLDSNSLLPMTHWQEMNVSCWTKLMSLAFFFEVLPIHGRSAASQILRVTGEIWNWHTSKKICLEDVLFLEQLWIE